MYATSGSFIPPYGLECRHNSGEQLQTGEKNTLEHEITLKIWQNNKRSSVGPELWGQEAAHPDHPPTSRTLHGAESSVLFEPVYFGASVITV